VRACGTDTVTMRACGADTGTVRECGTDNGTVCVRACVRARVDVCVRLGLMLCTVCVCV
jgi:hypothetical protein